MKHLLVAALAPLLMACQQVPGKKGSIELQRQTTHQKRVKPFANPAIIYGSDFLNFFASLKQNYPGKIETLLTYTGDQSRKRHSLKSILDLYRRTNLNFQKKLKAVSPVNDTLYVLNYLVQSYATASVISCMVVVENDTCRVVLPNNLNEFLK